MISKYSKKVILLTYNAGILFKKVLDMVINQKEIDKKDILVIDSSSADGTQQLVKSYDIELIVIPKNEFGHGKTRQMALEKCGNVDYVIFFTQDAIPFDENSIINIIKFFNKDKSLGAVYGRQIPYQFSDEFGAHARLYNYPELSYIRDFQDKKSHGIRTAFFSNTFGAYKKSVLESVGGFPDVEFGEDTLVAGKMLIQGYKVGYCAEAMVYHSHNLSISEEYNRYRQIGKFHNNEKWLEHIFGRSEGEGLRFVKSQIKYLVKNKKKRLIVEALVRDVVKYLAFKIAKY